MEGHEAEEAANAKKKKWMGMKKIKQETRLENHHVQEIATGNLHLHMKERG